MRFLAQAGSCNDFKERDLKTYSIDLLHIENYFSLSGLWQILNHINEPSSPPAIASARGPPEPEFDYDQMQDVAYAD